jgi:hypothetical protein
MERLQGLVKDLASHVAPFVALREMKSCIGPIYEFRTGKKSLRPRPGHVESDTIRISSVSMRPSPVGPLIYTVPASPPSIDLEAPIDSWIVSKTVRSSFLPVEAIASEKGQPGDPESRKAIVRFSRLAGKLSLRDLFSGIRRSSGYEGEEGGVRASQLTAKGRWKLAFDRIRLWSRVGSPSYPTLTRYVHQPLKCRTSLRLLKILPTAFGEILKCELIEVQPQTHPPDGLLAWNCEPFEAVSWLWSREVRDRTICIGDGSQWLYLEIPPSLDACLKALRLDDKPRLIWIDFLCSDRSNTQELDDQPWLFHSIFAAAENVCVWLGESDQDSDLAMDFIRTTAHISDSWWSKNPIEDPTTYSQQLDGVRALLQRPWFSRRWVIQEVAWSRHCVIYCDRHTISWEDFSAWISLIAEFETSTGRFSLLGTNMRDLHAFRIIEVCNNFFRRGNDDKRLYMMGLEYLVTSLSYFDVSVPHDTVYALLSLAAGGASKPQDNVRSWNTSSQKPLVQFDQEAVNFIGYHVDYTQPYDEFCKEFIQFSIHASGSLDIICRSWAPNVEALPLTDPLRKTKLPSWITTMKRAQYQKRTDLSNIRWQRINGDILVGLPVLTGVKYKASNESLVDFGALKFRKYRTHFSMYVRGFILGEIKLKSVASQAGNIPSEWPSFAAWNDHSLDPPEEYWRTLVANQGPSGLQAPSYYSRVIKNLYSSYFEGTDILAEDMNRAAVTPVVRQILRKIQAIVWNRSLARINRGNALALVPRDAQIGDLTCILYGCSVPVVLRRCFKIKSEMWEQRECIIREESAAVLIQRTYRNILLSRSSSSLKATARQEREREAVTESANKGGGILDKIRYAAILVIFLSLLRVWPGDTPSSYNFGLLAFAVLALVELYRIMRVSAGKVDDPLATATTTQFSAGSSRPPLALSKPLEPYYFSLVGECYVHGMMDGEAIGLQKEQEIPADIFELV